MEVTVKETATVVPARPTPRRTLWSSNADLIITRCHILTVYFYRPTAGSPTRGFFDTAVLKAALAEVLVPFYPAAGRVKLDGDGRPEIDCNEKGVVLVEAESNVALDEFGDFGPENGLKFQQLVPRVAAFGSEQDISACPLFLLQVTRFQCGGASLGVAFDHMLGDGFCALHLINSWADAARGALPVTPPFTDRTVLAACDPPAPSFPHPEYHAPPSISAQLPPKHKQSFVVASFQLTPADIERLKSRAAEAAGGRCGAYEAIVAHTWRCVCVARELPTDQKTRVYMPVSVLRRLNPPLPSSYMGNAVFSTACDATVGQVATWEPVVREVRAALAKMDDAYLRSSLDYLQLQPDLSKIRRGAHVYGSPNLNVNSWVQLPFYRADFGWGRPVFVGPASILCEGLVYVLPRPTAGDGLSLLIALHPAPMERFKNIFYDF